MLRFTVIALVALLVFNCSNNDTSLINDSTSGENGEIVFNISFAPWKQKIAKIAAIESIDKITAYVYNSNDTEITHKDMTISGSKYSGSITVQTANDLRVALVFFDGSIVRYIGEDSDVDVPAGGETTAVIVEDYMGTSVTAPDTAMTNTDFSVSWMERPFAEEYELEEATSNDFSGSATVYTGTATSKLISGKSDNDMTYYYRARVNTKYGYGPWHSTGGDATGIFATEGTIIIEGDVPPDEPLVLSFVSIPGGSFEMGDVENDGESDEKPVHTVTISSFEMSIYEVTNAQYAAYLNAALTSGDIEITSGDVYGKTGEWSSEQYLDIGYENNADNKCWITYNNNSFLVLPGYENWPVVAVSSYGAKAFAEYYGLDLPREAEFEYACRGGQQYKYGTDDGTISSNKANCDGNVGHPTDVGSYPANPFGLYDMSGNVTEWCSDYYVAYSASSQTNPTGPSTGSYGLCRGGGWTGNCRSADRNRSYLWLMHYQIGFRVVRRP